MSEKPQSTEQDVVEDDDFAEPGPGDNLVVSISRSVGAVARSVSDGINTMTEALRPRRRPARRRPAEESMEELLEDLGAMVSAHHDAGYGELRGNPEFWKLVAKLRQARRQDVARRMREVGTDEPGPGVPEEEELEAPPEPVAEPPATREKRRAKKRRAAPVAADVGEEKPAAAAEPAREKKPEPAPEKKPEPAREKKPEE